jgi:hypothetical protein
MLRDDIVAIRQFYSTEPWIRDAEGRYTGVFVRVYLVSAETEKGAFVPGTIKAAMYALTLRPDGTYQRELMHEWSFDQQQAAGYRVRKSSVLGDSYGFVLRWPAELELMGREVQVMFSYQKEDGEVIARRGSRFRVPVPTGHAYPQTSFRAPAPSGADGPATQATSRPPEHE